MPTVYPEIKIILAEDHEIFRDGFRDMLKKYPEINLIAEAENGVELLEKVKELKPDVILTDIKMPLLDGITATFKLMQNDPDAKIIAFTMFDEEHLIIDILEAGAKGYLLKNAHKSEIVEAIKSVYDGENYYCRQTSNRLLTLITKSKFNPRKISPRPVFTPKEVEVIHFVCNQFTNKEISQHMNLSLRTIEGYRERIQEKMKVKNTAGVVVYAIKNGIYNPS